MTGRMNYQSVELEQLSETSGISQWDIKWEILGTAEEIIDELSMLAMLHNFSNSDYEAMVLLQRHHDLESMGLKFDITGRLHINSAHLRKFFSQDSESLHRVTRILRFLAELDCDHEAL